ncbi:MAG: DegV family protein [Clostridia bacterium]|nr:DegV family protein [Clostridia bacterium]
MSFHILTDSCTDFPLSYVQKQKDLTILPLTYEIEGVSYTPDGTDAFTRAFYKELRGGKVAKTSQVNMETWKKAFTAILDKGQDILCIAFSGALSGTYQAAVQASEEVAPKYPDRKLIVIDSLSASLGQGLLVHYALQKRDGGVSLEETAQWIQDNLQHIAQWFTVDDLQFLRRGGRVSAVSAYIGGIVKIKPIMHVSPEGKLIPKEKVTGRKRSLRVLGDKVKEKMVDPANNVVFITHGDCEEEAQWLADYVKANVGVKDVMTGFVGPVIGSHSGPGTMAIFFLSTDRN